MELSHEKAKSRKKRASGILLERQEFWGVRDLFTRAGCRDLLKENPEDAMINSLQSATYDHLFLQLNLSKSDSSNISERT